MPASVTRTLQGIPGVASVSVDLPGGIARVLTRSNVGLGTMIIALAAAGYDASLRRTADPEGLVGGQR